jgi:hypothetical protein
LWHAGRVAGALLDVDRLLEEDDRGDLIDKLTR